LIGDEQVQVLDVLVNSQAFDKGAVMGRYAYRQFRSFWGNFGWVSLPLPEPLYFLIGALIVVAVGGLLYWAVRRTGKWSWREWLGLVTVTSFCTAAILTFAKQMAPLSTSGVHTDPHGRYLFVLMIPVVWLLLMGFGVAWSVLTRRELSVHESMGSISPAPVGEIVPWGVWLLCLTLFMFSAYCVLALAAPYFYG
jgi:hypothetical protein